MQNNIETSKPKVILIDVYDTMLDMTDIERRVNTVMDSKRGYLLWFELFMQYCFVDNCTVQFNDFSSIAAATMRMTAKTLGRNIKDTEIEYILELLKHLPLQEGTQEGLSLLYDNGYTIAALTNSPKDTVFERMERSGLISYFEMVLSAEKVKKYKPCTEVYNWAAEELGVSKKDILMVSVHGWDIAGAANAGMQTAYMRQDKEMLYPLAPSPNYICNSLIDLCNQLSKLNITVDEK